MSELLLKIREYTDVDFLFNRHPMTNNLTVKKNTNAVRQSVLHLLQLKKWDKPYHPEIYSPVYDFLFDNISAVTQVVIESEIIKYLNRHEPRLIIHSVNVSFPNPNEIQCEVTGEIINISTPITITTLINRLR